jgi:phage terminase small subunit
MKKKLTPKQKLFIKYYLIDFNATKAAIKAGYSKKTAKEVGCENLTKPNIKAEIEKHTSKVTKKLDLKLEDVIQEMKKTAFYDIDENVEINESGIVTLKQDAKLPPDFGNSISFSKDGMSKSFRASAMAKLKALEMLGKYLGMEDERNRRGNSKTDWKDAAKKVSDLVGKCNRRK